MNKQYIWKYTLQPAVNTGGLYTIKVPKYAQPLNAIRDEDDISVYYMVNPDLELENRTLYIFGTGQSLDGLDVGDYINTVMLPWPSEETMDDHEAGFHVFDWNR